MNTSNPREFYEKQYPRDTSVAGILSNDSFMYAQVLRQIRPYLRPGLKVLDLGCNTGVLSLYMAAMECDVLGIDLAENAVESALRSAELHGLRNAQFRQMDFLKDWDQPETFDFVLCCHVIEHIPDDAAFVRKIAFSMKSGASLVLVAPSRRSSFYRTRVFFTGRFPHDENSGHLRRYDSHSLGALCETANLDLTRRAHLDGALREWSILCKPLNILTRLLWQRKYVRSVFNGIDYALAQAFWASTECIHARKP
jgi:SAM-dependent methyltransferase